MSALVTGEKKRKTASNEGVSHPSHRHGQNDSGLTYEDGGFPDIVEHVGDVRSNDSVVKPSQQEPGVTMKGGTRVFRPGLDKLEEDEILDFDASAYKLYHPFTTQWPCLSFDILRDRLGVGRKRFPVTAYLVGGTQAGQYDKNELVVMKLYDLHKMQNDDSDSDEDADGSSEDESGYDCDPIIVSKSIHHEGGVNRVRSMPQKPEIVASWSDNGSVYFFDVGVQLRSLDGPLAPGSKAPSELPFQSFDGHKQEGFAMDWSAAVPGRFLTGDCDRYIYLHEPIGNEAAPSWKAEASSPFVGHTASVEDIQWSPSEGTVFASCSCDQSIRIWDTRQKQRPQLSLEGAHDMDVNVITWSTLVGYLMASGADDGSFKVWDLRNFEADRPVAHFKHHLAPITSIEWSPTDDSVIAVAGADHQISVWDMSMEEDREEVDKISSGAIEGIDDIPPQLLFVHQGQTDIKELHFHPQVPGVVVSTALDGFNIWRSCNL
jgi:ribosome assembly protein RRB1